MDYKIADLTNINQGAALDLFEAEFKKVLENVMDHNTKPDEVREVKIVCKVKPNKERNAATTTIHVTSKLANREPHESVIFVGKDGLSAKAYISNMNQTEMRFETPITKIN